MSDESINQKAITIVCGTCLAQPGQQCKRTKGQAFHHPRRLEAAKLLGMHLKARAS